MSTPNRPAGPPVSAPGAVANGQPPHQVRHHITNEFTSVSKVLMKHFGLDDAQVAELFHFGAIYSDKRRVFEDQALELGAYLRIHLKPKRFPVEEIDWKSCLAHETDEFVIVDKPPGIPTIPTVDNCVENVLYQMRHATGLPLLVTQRIDIPVGGIVVFGKTPRFQEWFNRALAERRVEKWYRAFVEKPMTSGRKTHYMEPSERAPKVVSDEEKPGWLKCELTINTCTKMFDSENPDLKPEDKRYEILLQLHTGRTHQIRTQLSFLGNPIVGDKQYGSTKQLDLPECQRERIGLACVRIQFRKGEPFEIELAPYWRNR